MKFEHGRSGDTVIGDRYRIESTLGRGGMAVVYQVHDLVRGHSVALKRLLEQQKPGSHIAHLFELEYHTLSQLVHPCIIEVYDFQSDHEGPFYTMELLTGGDLRRSVPVPWTEACRLLSDVCSALALLHSRRLVHRDLTPLNVRCMADGRVKLFDFGSMASFGRTKHIVGTPPFVAPEAFNGEVIDGRTDLYALGATAYYALTGQHAFPARELAELPDLWAAPPAVPSALVPGIPAALDELVLALLQLAPNARPLSAAEVIERLSAIGSFEVQEALLVRDAYLATPSLVGRQDQLGAVERHLRTLPAGQGAAILVDGAPGTGRSRLLDACALAAKLRGVLVLRADASGAGAQRWSAAGALLDQLVQQLPEFGPRLLDTHASSLAPVPRAATQHGDTAATLLGGASDLAAALGTLQVTRADVQTALQSALLQVAQHRPLMLVVDDLDRIDEPSAALLALLAHQVTHHRLLILGAVETAALEQVEHRSLQLLASFAELHRIGGLNAAHGTELFVSLFGDVANARWLADRLLGVTHGNPASMMRVARQLVRQGYCRYEAGVWTLPSSLDSAVLAESLRESVDPSLSDTARELARFLALGELSSLSFDDCLLLSWHRDLKQLHADIHALVMAGIVTVASDRVSLSRPGWEPLLSAGLSVEKRQRLHLRVAHFLERDPSASFQHVQQLVYAGEIEHALDIHLHETRLHRDARIADASIAFDHLQGLPKNWPNTYHTLIAACNHRPLLDKLVLQLSLVGYSTLSARYEGACLLEVAQQLRHDTGLDLIAELADRIPPSDLLARALEAAQRRYESTPERDRGLPLLEALKVLAQLTLQAIGMAGRTLDLPLLRAMPSLAPIAILSPALAIVQKDYETVITGLSGKTEAARRAYCEIAKRLEEPDGAGLQGTHRFHVHAAVLWAAGTFEANLGRPVALQRAAAIDHNPLFVKSALRLRALYALARGDRATAERYRLETELLEIQNSPPQLFEGYSAAQMAFAYAALGDLVQVKLYLAEIEAMAREHAGWKPVVHFARGAYQLLRGDHVQAERELESALAMTRFGEHNSTVYSAGYLVWALVHQTRFEAAAERGRTLLTQLEAAGLDMLHLVRIPLALAETRLGHPFDALTYIRPAIEELSAEGAQSVALGKAYEVRAYIAIAMADVESFREYASACELQYRLDGQDNGQLAGHAKLLRAARSAGLIHDAADTPDLLVIADEDLIETVSKALVSAVGATARGERALSLLGQALNCDAGFLYLVRPEGPTLTAQLGALTQPVEMDLHVTGLVRDAVERQDVTQTLVSDTSTLDLSQPGNELGDFTPLLLSHTSDLGLFVTGAAVMALPRDSSQRVPARLLQALSKAFSDAGDALALQTGVDTDA